MSDVRTKEHEHDWQLVQKQIIYEGVRIKDITFEDDSMFVELDSDSEVLWQDVAESLDLKISCQICNIEYPYPEGGWETNWP